MRKTIDLEKRINEKSKELWRVAEIKGLKRKKKYGKEFEGCYPGMRRWRREGFCIREGGKRSEKDGRGNGSPEYVGFWK